MNDLLSCLIQILGLHKLIMQISDIPPCVEPSRGHLNKS